MKGTVGLLVGLIPILQSHSNEVVVVEDLLCGRLVGTKAGIDNEGAGGEGGGENMRIAQCEECRRVLGLCQEGVGARQQMREGQCHNKWLADRPNNALNDEVGIKLQEGLLADLCDGATQRCLLGKGRQKTHEHT